MKQNLKTLTRILIILILYFLSQAVLMTVFAAIGGMGVQGDIQGAMEAFLEEKASLISLVHNGLIIAALLLYRRRSPRAMEEMPLGPVSLKEAALYTGGGICFALVVSGALSLLPIPESAMAQYSSALSSSISGTLAERLLSVVIFAPVAEELLFRGIIYGSFKKTARRIVAVAASCAIFGLMHQDPLWMIYAFIMGLGLTLTLDAAGTLLAPMLLHVAFNFTGSVITPLLDSIPAYILILPLAGCVLFIRKMAALNTGNREEK